AVLQEYRDEAIGEHGNPNKTQKGRDGKPYVDQETQRKVNESIDDYLKGRKHLSPKTVSEFARRFVEGNTEVPFADEYRAEQGKERSKRERGRLDQDKDTENIEKNRDDI